MQNIGNTTNNDATCKLIPVLVRISANSGPVDVSVGRNVSARAAMMTIGEYIATIDARV